MFRHIKRLIHQEASESGTVQDNINLGTLDRLRFPAPRNVAEQTAIAEILGALDDKIELNRRTNRTLEATAAAIFKSWFVDFDPVVAKADGRQPFGMDAETAALFPPHFNDSHAGAIPEGWSSGSISEIARYVNGRNFTSGATGTGRMVIRIAELNSGPGGSTVYTATEAQPDNTAFPGDLLFSWSGSLDVYRWHRDEALVNQHIFKVVSDSYPQWFVFHQLREAMPFFQGIASGKATTMGHIKREHLSQAAIALPPRATIEAADKLIRPLYDAVHRNERESLNLAQLRDTLLPKLLSGEVQAKQTERALAAAG
jgi:type I restriction enzyme S subunit